MTTLAPSNGSSLEIGQSNQDLIITKGKRKKRAWTVGGVVTLVIIILIIVALVSLGGEKDSQNALSQPLDRPAITLEDVLEGKLNSASFNATWISGDELIYKDAAGSILTFNVTKLSTQQLLPANTPILRTAFDYEMSPDQKYLLIAHDYQKLYRHSYVARYTIVNLDTKETIPVLAGIEPVLQFATWGPVGSSVVYVSHFNVYFRASAESAQFQVLTNDGLQGHIYNGIPDWVYEEEVFSSNKAIWFSPQSNKLAYAKFNDTHVPVMNIPVYGQPGNLEFQYPKGIQIRYPKPGTKNPDVSLHAVDLAGRTEEMVLAPPENLGSEAILASVVWSTEDTVIAVWMNRIQNEADIVSYNTKIVPPTSQLIKKIQEPDGWVELFTPPLVSKNGRKIILLLSQLQNDVDGSYRHVVMLNVEENSKDQPLTTGRYVVTEILSWDEERDLVYYQATTEQDPAVQHVYTVSTKTKETKCLSCKAKSNVRNTDCLHNSAMVSKDHSNFVLQCSGPDVPEIAIFTAAGNKTFVWEDNVELNELVQDKTIPKTKRLNFTVADGFKAQVNLKLPPNMDTSGKTKYPMLVNVYGGPDSYQVLEKFNLDWGSYLTSNKSIIYATIDARGTGLKGDKILFALYNKLGTVEVIDQINVTRQIHQTLPYVDKSRTAIWGWSYGGFASGMALAMDDDNVFKCGISVAPVTDWTLYDSIYTERFMGLPSKNGLAYAKARLLDKYEGLRNKQYYLIHGTLDDNVHYQQSMLWSKVLEEHDVLFRQQSYPDEDHSLGAVRPHLYHSLENFLDECFVVDIK